MINDRIKEKKSQHSLGKEGVKMSALSSGKLDKYGYLAGQDLA